jgi:probable addiction module antidote protein
MASGNHLASNIIRQFESLYRALSAEGNPEFATVLRVVEALGLQLSAVPTRRENAA